MTGTKRWHVSLEELRDKTFLYSTRFPWTFLLGRQSSAVKRTQCFWAAAIRLFLELDDDLTYSIHLSAFRALKWVQQTWHLYNTSHWINVLLSMLLMSLYKAIPCLWKAVCLHPDVQAMPWKHHSFPPVPLIQCPEHTVGWVPSHTTAHPSLSSPVHRNTWPYSMPLKGKKEKSDIFLEETQHRKSPITEICSWAGRSRSGLMLFAECFSREWGMG